DAMAEGADGTLWFSTPGALHRLGREQTLERLAITWGSGDRERISSILEDEQGQVFLAVSRGGGGLRRLRPAQVSMVGAADGLPCENVLTVTEGADGTAWVGLMCEGEPGLVAIRDGRVRVVRDAEGEPLHQVSALLALPGRQLWAGNLHGQLVRIAADGKLERP